MAIPRSNIIGRTFHVSGRHPFEFNEAGRASYMASSVHLRHAEVSGGRHARPCRAAVRSRWPSGRPTDQVRAGRPSTELGPLGRDRSARRRPPADRDRRANRRRGSEPSTGRHLRTTKRRRRMILRAPGASRSPERTPVTTAVVVG